MSLGTPCQCGHTQECFGTDARAAPAQRLAVLEEQFSAGFERSLVPQANVDSFGRLSLVNDALCALMGRSRQELVGVHTAELAHPQDPGTGGELLAALLSGQCESGFCERVLQAGDGSALPVIIHASVLRDGGGRVCGTHGHFQDLRTLRAKERARQRRDELTEAFARLANDLALVGDADGTLLYVSPAVTRLFGYSIADVLAGSGLDFVHPDDLPGAQQIYASVLTTGATATMLLRVRTSTGQWRWVEGTCHNMLDSSIGGIVCNLVDVTARVEAEQALRRSELRYRTLAETADEGIWAVDVNGVTSYANARVAAILGVSLEQVYARPVPDFLDDEAAQQVAVRLVTRQQRGPERYEVTYRHPDGTARHLAITAAPWTGDGDSEGSLKMLSDVTEARRAQAELAAAALRDRLTGLANRALLLDRLEQLVLDGTHEPVVLLVDLDHFKLVNNSLGHAAGDELLVAVADRLHTVVDVRDTVARVGGDEFVIVVQDGDARGGKQLAEDVLSVLNEPVELTSGDTVHVRASVGVAAAQGAAAGDLLRYADTAMYAAKAAGRGRIHVFDRDLADEVERRFTLAADLRAALTNDGLDLHYQPIVEIATGRVLGVEALARWAHPQRGAMPPDRFVPIAEMTGLGPDLDRYVLARALTQVGQLLAAGHLPVGAGVAVNLSARNLCDSHLDVDARHWAAAAGVPTSQVTLEITETAIMDEPELAIEMLRRLREAGFGIAIDDFGTGYSSLAYLRDLPVTALKIDRSFIRDLTTHADALAIAASIVNLGSAVSIDVVAEGVETLEQATLLRQLGCVSGQGFLWSPALSAEQLMSTGLCRQPLGVRVPDERLTANSGTSRRRPWRAPPVLAEHGLDRLLELHRQGASLETVAAALNFAGFRTPTGARWHRASVARAIADAVYPALTGRSGPERRQPP